MFLNTHYVSNTIVNILNGLSHLIFMTTLGGSFTIPSSQIINLFGQNNNNDSY